MRHRFVLAIAALAALAVAVPHAGAAAKPATLDGKKVTQLKVVTDAQQSFNDADLALATTEQRVQCEPPRCAVLPFVYAPAKGVKGDIAFEITWSNPYADMDLFVVEMQKNQRVRIASCGGSAGTSEKVFLPAGTLKKGKTYALISDFYRTPGEKVTSTIVMPGKDTVAKTVPMQADLGINCTL